MSAFARPFIHSEAAEDDSNSSTNGDGDDDDDNGFTFFTQLPYELRIRIWELLCPDLAISSGVLEFSRRFCHVESVSLPTTVQVSSRRLLGAVNKESRELMTQRFPNLLPLYSEGENVRHEGACIRFDQRRDIISLDLVDEGKTFTGDSIVCPEVRNVCLEISGQDGNARWMVEALMDKFPQLQRLYLKQTIQEFDTKHHGWSASEMSNGYRVEFEEEGYAGQSYNIDYLYCWPDMDLHPTFAKMVTCKRRRDLDCREELEKWGLEVSRLAFLETTDAILAWEDARRMRIPEDWASSSDSEEDVAEDLDDYESEGIDDEEDLRDADSSSSSEEAQLTDEAPEAAMSSPEPDALGKKARIRRRCVIDSDESELSDEPPLKRTRIRDISDSSATSDEEQAAKPKTFHDDGDDDEESRSDSFLEGGPYADEDEEDLDEDGTSEEASGVLFDEAAEESPQGGRLFGGSDSETEGY